MQNKWLICDPAEEWRRGNVRGPAARALVGRRAADDVAVRPAEKARRCPRCYS